MLMIMQRKQIPCIWLVEMYFGIAIVENSMNIFQKIKNVTIINPAIHF